MTAIAWAIFLVAVVYSERTSAKEDEKTAITMVLAFGVFMLLAATIREWLH